MNLYSRIVAVADVFDAMTSDRVYKKRSTPFDTFEMFLTVGISMFDTKILNVFLNNLAAYLIGSNVLLSNGEEGEIVFISLQNLTSPIIKISSGYLDFSKEKTVNIISML
jgi:HD-GYP domain-containing protein (c-di-GMP phosphodiesterase class II)